MGLINRKREVGSNFDDKKADEIFDSIENLEEKQMPKNIKGEINRARDIAELLKQAKSSDDKTAMDIYEKILSINPENYDAIIGLCDICRKNNDREREMQVLKKSVQNLSGTKKQDLIQRLKEIK